MKLIPLINQNKLWVLILIMFSTLTLNAQEVLTLERTLQYAESNSPNIQSTLLSLERSQQNLNAQRARLKSQFSLTLNPVSYSNTRTYSDIYSEWYTSESFSTGGTFRVEQPILPTGGTISLNNRFQWQNRSSDFNNSENQSFTNNLYLQLSQPLFTYNATKMDLAQLELDYENSNINYALQRLNLERSVTQSFYNVYLAKMRLDIAQTELENTQESYTLTQNKVEAGLIAKEELYQAELNLANSRSSLQNSEVSYENSKDQLKLNIGMDLYEDIEVVADPEVKTVEVDLNKAIEQGLSSRMELRQREIDIENSQFNMITTKATNSFQGDLNLSLGITGEDEIFGNIYTKDNRVQSPQVSLSFNIPIFDWGERKARIAAQEAVLKTQELNLVNEQNQIIIDIRSVYRNLQNQSDQIEIAQMTEENAQLTYDINLERYENGDLTGLDLSLYQGQLSSASLSYAQAIINYKLELLNLKIQTLYDFENNIEVVPSELYLNE